MFIEPVKAGTSLGALSHPADMVLDAFSNPVNSLASVNKMKNFLEEVMKIHGKKMECAPPPVSSFKKKQPWFLACLYLFESLNLEHHWIVGCLYLFEMPNLEHFGYVQLRISPVYWLDPSSTSRQRCLFHRLWFANLMTCPVSRTGLPVAYPIFFQGADCTVNLWTWTWWEFPGKRDTQKKTRSSMWRKVSLDWALANFFLFLWKLFETFSWHLLPEMLLFVPLHLRTAGLFLLLVASDIDPIAGKDPANICLCCFKKPVKSTSTILALSYLQYFVANHVYQYQYAFSANK